MRIDEQRVFRFVFPFYGLEATFNVVAENREEAVEKIQKWMSDTMVELSMSFPKVQPVKSETKTDSAAKEELQINVLIEDLSKHLAPVRDHETSLTNNILTIKEWIKMDYLPENFIAITEELKRLKTMYETGKIKKAGR